MKTAIVIIIILALAIVGYIFLRNGDNTFVTPPPEKPEELSLDEFLEKYDDYRAEAEDGVIFLKSASGDKIVIFDTNEFLGEEWVFSKIGGIQSVKISPDLKEIVFAMINYQLREGGGGATATSVISIYNIETKKIREVLTSEAGIDEVWAVSDWNGEGILVRKVATDINYTTGMFIIGANDNIIREISLDPNPKGQ